MIQFAGSMKTDGTSLLLVLLFLTVGKGEGPLRSLIIGGREAVPHSRPYMVSIQIGGTHACGGALLKAHWVLTAAHCLKEGRPTKVVVGLHQLSKEYDQKQVFNIKRFLPYPSYNRTTLADDIMLLKLDRKVAKNKMTQFIPLSKEPAPGTLCSVAGWGIVSQESKPSPVLRELSVKVMDARMCNNSRYWNGELTSTMMCIEGVQKGSAPCKGDSGGPVVCGRRAEVAGVLSFTGKRCSAVFKPPVATAVFKYKKWIQKNLR